MRREPAYAAVDPNSGEAVPMASQQQFTQPEESQLASAETSDAKPPEAKASDAKASDAKASDAKTPDAAPPVTASRGRGLFSFTFSPAPAKQSEPQQAYAQAAEATPAASGGHGPFTSPAHPPQQDAQQADASPPKTAPKSAPDVTGALYSSSPAYAQQAYAEPSYPQAYQPEYAQPQAAESGGRGLFTSWQRAPRVYAQPMPQPYVVQDTAPPYAAPQTGESYAAVAFAPAGNDQPYTLDAGDKLRVVVFGQAGISNSYLVGAGGTVNLPLIGSVPARGLTTEALSRTITARLKQGYVRDPHVSVEIETYRPFFILGEVTTPGQYPYVADMTAETAVAIAGGFAPRAYKRSVEITRNAPGGQVHASVPLDTPLRPGDTVTIKERWF